MASALRHQAESGPQTFHRSAFVLQQRFAATGDGVIPARSSAPCRNRLAQPRGEQSFSIETIERHVHRAERDLLPSALLQIGVDRDGIRVLAAPEDGEQYA